jgi:hypothetical protein
MREYMTMKTIVQVIAAAHYMADAAQVERLAGAVVEGQQADATYMRVILANMQAQLGKPRRGRRSQAEAQSAEAVLDSIHETLYAAVLRGVGPEELEQTERNRRATFARSAASTVRFFIKNGGDVRSVDVATVTKSGLRASVQPETKAPENETRAERTFRKAQDALVRSAQRLVARGDPVETRARIEAAMDALEALLESIPEGNVQQAPADIGGTTTTVFGRAVPGRSVADRPGAQLHRSA